MSKTANRVSFGAPFYFSNNISIDIKMNFKLEQVFCSCPLFPSKEIVNSYTIGMHNNIDLEILDSSCPCTKGKMFVRHLTEQELDHYKRKIPD